MIKEARVGPLKTLFKHCCNSINVFAHKTSSPYSNTELLDHAKTSGQSYKASTSAIYNSIVKLTSKLLISMTLQTWFWASVDCC